MPCLDFIKRFRGLIHAEKERADWSPGHQGIQDTHQGREARRRPIGGEVSRRNRQAGGSGQTRCRQAGGNHHQGPREARRSSAHPTAKTPEKPAAPAPAKAAKPAATPAKPAAPAPAAKTGKKPAASAKAAAPVTVIVAKYDVGIGNSMFIRGEGAGLSWESGTAMENAGNDVWVWTTNAVREGAVSFKFLINDEAWSTGDNMTASAGETTTLRPSF